MKTLDCYNIVGYNMNGKKSENNLKQGKNNLRLKENLAGPPKIRTKQNLKTVQQSLVHRSEYTLLTQFTKTNSKYLFNYL